jgi:integrase
MSADELKPSTVESYYRVLAAVMRAAVVDKLIAETPCRAVKLPRRTTSTSALVPLTVEQVQLVARGVPPSLRALVLVSAGLGLRQGEACGLTVDRVDFLRRKVTIDRQMVTPSTGRAELGPPKTVASARSLPLPDAIGIVLAEHIRLYGVDDAGLLFRSASGEPLRRQRWDAIFKAATTKAKVDATPHDLRHHAASLLISSGCSVKAVQHFLGHATAAETLDTYGHLWPDDDDKIRAALDSAYAATPAELEVAR